MFSGGGVPTKIESNKYSMRSYLIVYNCLLFDEFINFFFKKIEFKLNQTNHINESNQYSLVWFFHPQKMESIVIQT